MADLLSKLLDLGLVAMRGDPIDDKEPVYSLMEGRRRVSLNITSRWCLRKSNLPQKRATLVKQEQRMLHTSIEHPYLWNSSYKMTPKENTSDCVVVVRKCISVCVCVMVQHVHDSEHGGELGGLR